MPDDMPSHLSPMIGTQAGIDVTLNTPAALYCYANTVCAACGYLDILACNADDISMSLEILTCTSCFELAVTAIRNPSRFESGAAPAKVVGVPGRSAVDAEHGASGQA
jgi:hypothetical protein